MKLTKEKKQQQKQNRSDLDSERLENKIMKNPR